jgi:hypothetical protein
MTPGSYDAVKGQIGCCGIWCGSCVVGNGALAELTRRYARLVELYGLSEWGPPEVQPREFARALHAVRSMAPCRGCRLGGGRDDCELRACATAKRVADCTECDAQATCPHEELLAQMRAGAREAGLFVRTRGAGRARALAAWQARLPALWPHTVLFDAQFEAW